MYLHCEPSGRDSLPTRRSSDLRARGEASMNRVAQTQNAAFRRRSLTFDIWRGRRDSKPATSGVTGRRSSCEDRKSTRLNSSHLVISYAVFCFKKELIVDKLSRK